MQPNVLNWHAWASEFRQEMRINDHILYNKINQQSHSKKKKKKKKEKQKGNQQNSVLFFPIFKSQVVR